MRSPLNAIIGFSELLGDEMLGPLNEQQQEVVSDILSAGRHLLRLMNDVLDLTKISTGRMELQLQPLSVAAAADEALALACGACAERAPRACRDVPPELTVRADERRVVQVLCNLLTNAIRYSPPGSAVRLAAAVEGEQVRVSVSDDGCGIAPEDQQRVFDEFVSIDQPGYPGGTGLGLAVTRRLVALMGGSIAVSSAPGEGSTFTFTLPRCEVPKGAEVPQRIDEGGAPARDGR